MRLAYTRLTIGRIRQWLFEERRADGRCPNLARNKITGAANEIMRRALLNVNTSWIEEDEEGETNEDPNVDAPEPPGRNQPGNDQTTVRVVYISFTKSVA